MARPALALPEGFVYRPEFIAPEEEQTLLAAIAPLPFREFEFHGYKGRRRVVSFGWRYDFEGAGLQKIEPLPAFLLPLRDRAADFAGLPPDAFEHALVTEYPPGAPIGWHRDRSVFGDVVGVSLLAPCVFRFRRKLGAGWERAKLIAEPRSAYLLRGAARQEWEHSISEVEAQRYSITFRTLKAGRGGAAPEAR